jgi:hypothetical protein
VNNGLFETSHGSHTGVDMERIGVLAKSVDEALVRESLFNELNLMRFLRSVGDGRGDIGSLESEPSKPSHKERSIDVVHLFSLSILSDLIAGLPHVDDSVLSFVLDIDNLAFLLVLGEQSDFGFDHEEFFLSVEQVVEGEGWDVRAGDDQLESSSGLHGGGHGGKHRKTFMEFVGILVVFFPEGI